MTRLVQELKGKGNLKDSASELIRATWKGTYFSRTPTRCGDDQGLRESNGILLHDS
jgi:hypothetical protein